jgi:hypothetical protein
MKYDKHFQSAFLYCHELFVSLLPRHLNPQIFCNNSVYIIILWPYCSLWFLATFTYIVHLQQQCHNSVTTVSQQCHNSVTTVSQLKMCDFSGETFKGFEAL